jgi:hypothetical protein
VSKLKYGFLGNNAFKHGTEETLNDILLELKTFTNLAVKIVII